MTIQERIITADQLIPPISLVEQAANFKQLTLRSHDADGRAESSPICQVNLDRSLLEVLSKQGFVKQDRPDKVFTLIDEKSGNTHGTTDYWNFREEDSLVLSAGIFLFVNTQLRGVVLEPRVYGSFISPGHLPTHIRMAQAITGYTIEAPEVLRQVAQEGKLVVTYREIGVSGVRTIRELFEELFGRRESVNRLAHSHLSPFNPPVHSPAYGEHPEKNFVPEELQPILLQQWKKQLENFKSQLY